MYELFQYAEVEEVETFLRLVERNMYLEIIPETPQHLVWEEISPV